MQVAPGIHRIETLFGERLLCVYALVGEDRTLLIDSGVASTPSEYILPYLRQIGCVASSIDLILTTHADFDHMGGNSALRDLLPNARFLAHHLDRAWIEDVRRLVTENYGQFNSAHGLAPNPAEYEWICANASGTTVDREIGEGDEIELSRNWHVQILHTPGHTRGHLTVFDPRSHSAIIADAALSDGLYSYDGRPMFPPTYRYVASYRDSLDRLKRLAPRLLLTSHYEVMAGNNVENFLSRSAEFTQHMEQAVLDHLSSIQSPIAVSQLAAQLMPGLGAWPQSACQFLFYPLVGHLEELEAAGLITGQRCSGIICYRMNHG